MEGFFRRTYRTAALVALLVALGLWVQLGWADAVAFLVGVLVGMVFLAGIVFVVQGTVRAPEERPKRRWPYGVVYIGKFVVAAAAIYLVARWSPDRLWLVAAGYGLPIAVIVLKIIGGELNRRLGVKGRKPQSERSLRD